MALFAGRPLALECQQVADAAARADCLAITGVGVAVPLIGDMAELVTILAGLADR